MPITQNRKQYLKLYRAKNAEKIRLYQKEYLLDKKNGIDRTRVKSNDKFRKCFGCLEIKPLEEFYKNCTKPAGRGYSCISCFKASYQKRQKERRQNRDAFKVKARSFLRHSVRVGKISKLPCQICGNKKSQGHHEDYSKPLEVVWLCQTHHSDLHKQKRINQKVVYNS